MHARENVKVGFWFKLIFVAAIFGLVVGCLRLAIGLLNHLGY